MMLFLGEKTTNHKTPNPVRVRDRNSPVAPDISRQRHTHSPVFTPCLCPRQLALARRAAARGARAPVSSDQRPRKFCFRYSRRHWLGVMKAKKPIRVGETEARSATKEGVVRYILLASLVLVVVLFAIAWVFFH
jgi:hypothetical protein